MLVYFNWNNGDIVAAGFSKPERAAAYVIEKIEEYIGIRKKTPETKLSKKKKSSYFVENNLQQHVELFRQQIQAAAAPPQPIYGGGGGGAGEPQVPYMDPPLWQVVMPQDQAIAAAAVPAPPPVPAFENFALQAQQPEYPPEADDMGGDEYDYPSPPRKIKKARMSSNKESPEFAALTGHLEIANKDKTIENARKAIKLYDEYIKFVLGAEPLLHTIQEVKVDDDNI